MKNFEVHPPALLCGDQRLAQPPVIQLGADEPVPAFGLAPGCAGLPSRVRDPLPRLHGAEDRGW